jgi:hypothetical protein
MTEPKLPWLVTCSCGWTRECSSEWTASSVAKLHPKLAPTGVEHATRAERPLGHGESQLTLSSGTLRPPGCYGGVRHPLSGRRYGDNGQ